MILLQAAMGYGLLLIAVFGGGIFLGIPVISILVFDYLKQGETRPGAKQRTRLLVRSVLIATAFIAILLFLIWLIMLSTIDLSGS